MNDDDRFWDRNALYEEVWSTPMRKLAERYGISDVALAKNCRKMSIPLPGRGYWAKVSAGQSVTKSPLPSISSEVRLKRPIVRNGDPSVDPIGSTEQRRQIERLEHSSGETFLKRGSLSHPLIIQARNALRQAREDDRKILQGPEQCLDVRVSKGSLERALRVMAALINLLEAEGFVLSVGDGRHGHTAAKFHGQEITFGLLEKVDRIDAISLPSESTLSIEIWHPWEALRKRWKDGKRGSLEAVLPKIVASFIQTALEEKDREEKRLVKRQEEERTQQEREKLRSAIRYEKARGRALHRAALNWSRATQIRNLVRAARDAASEHGQAVEAGTAFGDWLIWAERQADRIDPVKESPGSIVDRMGELPPQYPSLYGYREVEPRFDFPKPLWK
jgi:hypothetical protein